MSEGAEFFEFKPFMESIVEMIRINDNTEIVYPTDKIEIYMNKTALEQILMNLLQNALKYNDSERPRVDIGFSMDDAYYYFSVKDNGKGIAVEEQEKIFELFTTLGGRDRFGTKGTGIGLSTVKKLVEKMSGRIEVKSIPGAGSEFSFSIKKEK
jgi:signal transduction histidine kinase